MPSYNSRFELTVDDMDLIESALQRTRADLTAQPDQLFEEGVSRDDRLRQVHDLLGRLHNQKVFYRPRRAAYIGG
ncbi:hypothetical protein [uncultured Roseovarius sp.]|uniref:hypothetical protein n=1 Tax=uncultured Roseovarius sp. TaxID=293344 RepID=UPI002634BA71|nr:hypothetical protein [uncultured Roseovarius sp.]